jgi:hypothetical protein
MFDKIFDSLSKLKYQTLLLVGGLSLIILSSFEIEDITKLQIHPAQNPSYPVLAIGIIALVLSIILFFFLKESIVPPPEKELPRSLYYRFYGLKGVRNDDNVFQDFIISCQGNPNAVQFLWADACYSNVITGKIIYESAMPCLRVRFDHRGGYGCNIAIRSKNSRAFSVENKYRFLTFDAKIPREELDCDKDICIAVRIVNGYFQQWEYAIKSSDYIHLSINKNEWGDDQASIKIDLASKESWYLFTSDGNSISLDGHCDYTRGTDDPDFSVISAVILKFGTLSVDYSGSTKNSRGEPAIGKGVVDIRALRFIKDNNS